MLKSTQVKNGRNNFKFPLLMKLKGKEHPWKEQLDNKPFIWILNQNFNRRHNRTVTTMLLMSWAGSRELRSGIHWQKIKTFNESVYKPFSFWIISWTINLCCNFFLKRKVDFVPRTSNQTRLRSLTPQSRRYRFMNGRRNLDTEIRCVCNRYCASTFLYRTGERELDS